jgi:hypothetical protein
MYLSVGRFALTSQARIGVSALWRTEDWVTVWSGVTIKLPDCRFKDLVAMGRGRPAL